MDVVFDFLGHGEVDHMLDLTKVQPLGGHAGSDHHVLLAFFERSNGILSLLLRFAAVNGHSFDALHEQVFLNVYEMRTKEI